MAKVAIMGMGTVGLGTAEVLTKNKETIARRVGREIEIKHILCNTEKKGTAFDDVIIYDFELIVNDPEVEVVAECIGGIGKAYEYNKRCLEAGKSVVTANKELVATHGLELCDIARRNKVNFMFEASVGGGIPILRPLSQCLAANEISSVCGILNGTTNYILTEMIQFGKSFEAALAEAQEKGYAEADPTADVEGIDAARKTAILADICFGKNVPVSEVKAVGISKITSADIEYARSLGYKIKLLGRAIRTGSNSVAAFVEPHLISNSHPLASVDGVINGITVKGDAVGEAMFFGPGAGAHPTGSAVAADIADCIREGASRPYLGWWPSEPGYVMSADELSCRFMIRTGADLALIGEAFGRVRFIGLPGSGGEEYAFVTEFMTGERVKKLTEGMDVKSIYRMLD